MTSEEQEHQQQLVSVLYSVHDKLRSIKSHTKDDKEWQKAWVEHTSDLKTLQEYSKAMHDLATKIWEPRNTLLDDNQPLSLSENINTKKLKCRLEWVVQCCDNYFKRNFEVQGSMNKLSLLDVGSCYNPFSKYDNYFDIVALDLCPAPGFENQVFQCDFLQVNLIEEQADASVSAFVQANNKVNIGATGNVDCNKVINLPRNSFDVVVFSFFLEYLADPQQRVESCRNAFVLLRPNGLLFILRPDSSRVTPGGNNVLMKKMKVGMALLGFKRLYFEKLEHLWCMAFKKLDEGEKSILTQGSYFKRDVVKVGAEFILEDLSRIQELFTIAQDMKRQTETDLSCPIVDSSVTINNIQHDTSWLEELPGFEVSSNSSMTMS